jgi:hypothetical protein
MRCAGFFSDEVIRMLPQLRLLDSCKRRTRNMGSIGVDYITHRLLHTSLPVHPLWGQIRSIAARLAPEDDEHQENYPYYVRVLCRQAAEFDDSFMSIVCAQDWFPECEPDQDYDYNLLAAAAYTNKCRVIEQLVDHPPYVKMVGGLFGNPHVCAAIADHDAALDLLFDKFEVDKKTLLSNVSRSSSTRMVEKFAPERPVLSPLSVRKFYTPDESIYWTPNVETFEMLRRKFPQQEISKDSLKSLLEDAASYGWEDILRHILPMGAPTNQEYCKLQLNEEVWFDLMLIVSPQHSR